MRKLLFLFTAVILAASCRAQSPGIPIKTAGIVYSKGVPQWVPQLKSGSEIDIDTTTGHIYQWHRTNNSWLQLGQGIDVISGTIPPLYTPVRNMSLFAINAADELYHWTGSGWVQINQGTAYTAGAGIDITGDEISNTGDLSNTNELQTITTSTNTLTLSNSGGTVTVDTDPTNEAQTLSAGGTTSPTIGLSTAGGAGGGTVTLSPAGIMFFSRTGNTIIATATEVDGSVTNEIELPAQTGNSGKYLTTNGSSPSWGAVSGTVGPGTAGQLPYYATTTTLGTATVSNGLTMSAGALKFGGDLTAPTTYNSGSYTTSWPGYYGGSSGFGHLYTATASGSTPTSIQDDGIVYYSLRGTPNYTKGFHSIFRGQSSQNGTMPNLYAFQFEIVGTGTYTNRAQIFNGSIYDGITTNTAVTASFDNYGSATKASCTDLVLSAYTPTSSPKFTFLDFNQTLGVTQAAGYWSIYNNLPNTFNMYLGQGRVSIGATATPAASAALDITSTTSGFLPPRMTTAQRNAISSPATGLTIYCTDATATDASTGVLQCYNGTTWKNCW